LWLSSRFGSFRKSNADVDIELRPSGVAPDFVGGEADVYIQYVAPRGELRASAQVRALRLAAFESFPVASPGLLARIGPVRTARDLIGEALLHEDTMGFWRDWFLDNGVEPGDRIPGPRLWDAALTIDAARAGEGVALGCHFLANDDIAAGRLVEVTSCETPLRRTAGGEYYFLAREDRWNTAPIAKFRAWLTSTIATEIGPHAS
jgi:DNA-binding transcriptional LysR family regulator